MTRWWLYIVIVSLSVGSCSLPGSTNNHDSQIANRLAVSPSHVTGADTVTIYLPQPHPTKLAIEGPHHAWFTIHDESAFRRARVIRFRASALTGIVWLDGQPRRQKVFVLPGTYTIYLANNLETEPENTFSLMQSLEYTP